jgi:sugar phosphate isomerase/epimerase
MFGGATERGSSATDWFLELVPAVFGGGDGRAHGAGTPVQYDEGKVPHEAFKEVGRGEVDFAAFLPAAAKAGVKYYYVEQDYSAGSPLDSLRTTRQALATLVASKKG